MVLDNPPAGDPSRDWYIWRVADDERVCPVCAPLEGATINGARGPFPPLHTRCRCWLQYSHSDPPPAPDGEEEPLIPPTSPGLPGPY